MSGAIVITMAGFGSRFRKAGYTQPKYQIRAHGHSLFEWSMLSLDQFRQAGWQFHFILREAEGTADWVRAECATLDISDPRITALEQPTDGQATTALLVGPELKDRNAGFLVYNIDTFVEPGALDPARISGCDGWIPCADLPGDAWSFARVEPVTDAHGTPRLRAVELREKRRISNHATIGLYHFASFACYRKAYDAFYADPANLEAGERYIAPVYNQMIKDGRDLWIEDVPASQFHALGTPADVDAFQRRSCPDVTPDQMRMAGGAGVRSA